MILTCPACSMRYLIADSAIGAEGRKVRCASCGHEWFEEGVGEAEFADILEKQEEAGPVEDIPESVKPIPEGSNVPARPEDVPPAEEDSESGSNDLKGRLMGYAAAASVMAVIVGALVIFAQPVARAWPPSLLLYDMIGADVTLPGEGLIIDQVKATARGVEGEPSTLVIRGSVINLKDQDIEVPRVLATLWREDNSAIESWVIDLPYDVLSAEQSFDFEAEYPGVPDEAQSVNLSFAAFMPKKKTAPPAEENHTEEHAGDHDEESHGEEPHAEDAHHDEPTSDNHHEDAHGAEDTHAPAHH